MMNHLFHRQYHKFRETLSGSKYPVSLHRKLLLQPLQHSNRIGVMSCLMIQLFVVTCLSSFSAGADIGKYFTRGPQSIVAPPGDRVTFQCETNIPAEQVRWKLNGRFLHPANETDIRVSGTFLSVKVSKNRERYLQQIGDYQCVAEFGAEALTSLPAQLSIAQLDPFKPHINKTLEVVEGNTVAISCDAPYSNPPPVIQFYKDGRPVEAETGNSMLTESGILHLYNVSFADAGSYWCSITNHITTDTYVADWVTQLVILPKSMGERKAPKFLVKPKPYYIIPEDGNVTLECVAIGNPPPYTTWRELRAPTMTNYQSNKGTLHLYNVRAKGNNISFICEAYNGVGEVITSRSTIILNSMPNITKEPMSLIVEEGGEAIIDCASEGLPKPRMYWVFNGQNVHDDENVEITDGGLRILRVEKKHAGLFQCFATNQMGTVTSPAELKVMPKQITAMASDGTVIKPPVTSVLPPVTDRGSHHGYASAHHHKNNKFHRGKHKRPKHKGQEMTPPSKPSINRLSDESVMIRWEVPPNSGYPIQFFKIQYKEVSRKNSRWMTIDDDIAPHINSYEVRDLRVGHAYRFRIAAVYSNNDNKVGPNSEKFVLQKDALMRRPMYAPVITNAVPHNISAILLKWKVMKMEASGLDGYFIYYREATSAGEYSKVTVLGVDTEFHYIDHLKPGTAYDIKIQSFNRAGASNFSSIVAAKTTGTATTERPDYDSRHREDEIIVPEDEPSHTNEHLYLLMGCIFVGFWIFICLACAVCYRCRQKRAEDEAKYPCDVQLDLENKSVGNGINGHIHSLNGYIPTITSQLDEKETSFVERHNNNRPISPSLLNSSACDLSSFKTSPLDPNLCTEMKAVIKRGTESNSRSNSLKRSKHSHTNGNGSLRKGQYMSCSSEDLDCDEDKSKDAKIFPKEHYKARKHNRKRSSMTENS